MDALSGMQTVLRNRPSKFKSLDFAIEWCVRTGQVKNLESARVSMPGQLKNAETGKCATSDVGKKSADSQSDGGGGGGEGGGDKGGGEDVILKRGDSIAEEDEEREDGNSPPSMPAPAMPPPAPTTTASSFRSPVSVSHGLDLTRPNLYAWRIDLANTEAHWPSWFEGLTNKFLSVPASKLLVLAGVDRLDRDLTIGQMQGKFQMQVLPQAGHAVHEDVPDRVADVLATFMVRNKFAEPLDDFERTFPAC
jgi:protein phosphatase methylesterase 1